MHYLGIDIGGTSIKAGLVDEDGHVLESRRTPTIADDLDGFLSTLAELVREFQKTTRIEAIGLGVPGLRSAKTHIIKTSPNIPCLHEINLEDAVADQVHIRTVSENDANTAAYAEFVCGAGAGLKHLVHLTLGTGLGSGLILNGSLFTGTSGYAAEFGHTILNARLPQEAGGRLCACGNVGCAERFVSATGIVITAEEVMRDNAQSLLHGIEPPLTSEKIHRAALQGDEAAQEVFKRTGWYLGIACANLINLLNLDMIVIGGGVMAAGDLLLNPARASAKFHAFPYPYADCEIVQSKLWPDGGVIGAAMIARDR
jgi:glucokinase